MHHSWLLMTSPSPCPPHPHTSTIFSSWMLWRVNSRSTLSACLSVPDAETRMFACVITGPGHLEQHLCNQGLFSEQIAFSLVWLLHRRVNKCACWKKQEYTGTKLTGKLSVPQKPPNAENR